MVDDELAGFDRDIAQVAEELLAGSAAHWWWQPLDIARQTVVANDIDDVLGQIEKLAQRHAPDHSIGLMATSSTWLGDDLPAAQLADPGFVARDRQRMRCFSVTVRADAAVLEVRTAAELRQMCETYPLVLPTPPVSGQLEGTGVPFKAGPHTVLWLEADSEMTVWLHNVLESGTELASVHEITERW